MAFGLLITCEHATNFVPSKFASAFSSGGKGALSSHRGWDPGSLEVAKYLSKYLNVSLFRTNISRLLIDQNRSLNNPELFSKFALSLSDAKRRSLISDYYEPHREEIIGELARLLASSSMVVHFGIHTFTPIRNGIKRTTDLGVLFDPKRLTEVKFAKLFLAKISSITPELAIKYNDPYRGDSDGLTTYLRKQYSASRYLGIEIEINSKLRKQVRWQSIKQALAYTIKLLTK